MDGNRRWAKERGLPSYEGHRAGTDAVKRTIEFAVNAKIEVLTLFALSIENHEFRPSDEVQFLLSLLLESLRDNTIALHEKNIRVRLIGDRSQFGESLLEQIRITEKTTQVNTGMTLVLATNYSGRWDIIQATRAIARKVNNQQIRVLDINEQQLSEHMCLSDLPEPDLFIRTSGELRISNFMLWQLSYTELFFPKEFWPDFDPTVFQRALEAYAQRERRFGLTNDQIRKDVINTDSRIDDF